MLDEFDRKILAMLQVDSSLSMQEVADRVGLSSTPCWRRIQKLERSGYIKRRVALLDAEKLDLGVSVFIAVRTNQHNAEWVQRFRKIVVGFPEVVDFYRLSGDVDYLIRAVVSDIRAYDDLYQRLISKIDLFDVSSMFTMEQIKSTTELPLGPSASKAERPVRASRAAPKVGLGRQADAVPVSRHRGTARHAGEPAPR
jgi:Lrp/AsnC family transcriptional regulator